MLNLLDIVSFRLASRQCPRSLCYHVWRGCKIRSGIAKILVRCLAWENQGSCDRWSIYKLTGWALLSACCNWNRSWNELQLSGSLGACDTSEYFHRCQTLVALNLLLLVSYWFQSWVSCVLKFFRVTADWAASKWTPLSLARLCRNDFFALNLSWLRNQRLSITL